MNLPIKVCVSLFYFINSSAIYKVNNCYLISRSAKHLNCVMKFYDFWFYVFAFLCGGNWKEEEGHTLITRFLSSFKDLFYPEANLITYQNTPHKRKIYEIRSSQFSNKNSGYSDSHKVKDSWSSDPENLSHETMGPSSDQISAHDASNLHGHVITLIMIIVILLAIIWLLLFTLKKYRDRTEKITLEKVDKSLQELRENMIKVSDDITEAAHHFLRQEISRCDEKYSELLSTLSKALQFQRVRNEEREARSCYLIMKFRSARLLQYGQLNTYLESLLEHVSKEHSDIISIRNTLKEVKMFTNDICSKISENKSNSHRLVLEILQFIHYNALYEKDKIKSSNNLKNMAAIMQAILKKKK